MATQTQVSKLFIALFNRATDKNVFDTFASGGINPTIVRELISGKHNEKLGINQSVPENNRAFVELLYKNVLGRTSNEDKEGIDYWVSLLEGSSAEPKRDPMSKEDLVINFLAEVQRYEKAAGGSGKLELVLLDGTKVEHTINDQDKNSIKVFQTKIEISDKAANKVNKVDSNKLIFGQGLSEITATNAETAKQNALSVLDNLVLQNPTPPETNAPTPPESNAPTPPTSGVKLRALEPGDASRYKIKGSGLDATIDINHTGLVTDTPIPANVVAKIISSVLEGGSTVISHPALSGTVVTYSTKFVNSNIQHLARDTIGFKAPKEDLTGSYKIEAVGDSLVYTPAGSDKPTEPIQLLGLTGNVIGTIYDPGLF